MMKRKLRFFYVFFIFSILSCGSYEYDQAMYGETDEAGQTAPAPEMSRMMKMENEAPPAATMADSADISSPAVSPSPEKPRPEEQRKRIYNGAAGLVVENLAESRKTLEETAVNSGGYVEQSYADYLVLRIPAEKFNTIFSKILLMGKVRYQQIDTWDVTDQYQDTQARLTTAEETRRRLYVLLEKSSDPEERAKILREIGRLTEEIESIKQQLQIMDSRIAFSRITVELIPRLQEDAYRGAIPFDWIASLSPLAPASDSLNAKIKLNPGKDFALFSKEDIYVAEDAFGTSLTVSTVKNSPLGDSSFWQKALHHHLKDYYGSAELKDLSFGDKEMPGVEFVSKDREPFRYFCGLVVDKKSIHIVEIFSPDGEKDFNPLYKALKEGECR